MDSERNELERQILLAESGELADGEAGRLEGRLAEDAGARAYRDDLRRIVALARASAAAAEPAPAALARIRAAAAAAVPPLRFPAVAARVLAYAAALALVVGGWLALGPDRGHDRIGHMHTIVAMVSEEGAVSIPETSLAEEERLRQLARDLLLIEGFSVDEAAEAEPAAAEPPTTTLRFRSSAAWSPERCV